MTPIGSFVATAAAWQNFYLLCGTAAATLIGLMFVAVTFGAGYVSAGSSATARAFTDPPFNHFVHVLLTACVMVSPAIDARFAGGFVLVMAAWRTYGLVGIYRRMRFAHATYGDLELSDWLSGVVAPLLCYLALGGSGGAFIAGWSAAFAALAVVTVVVLLLGVFAAWELMMWLAMKRSERAQGESAQSE